MLTVHLIIILVNNQFNTQILVFIISLLYACICFEQYVFIIRRSKLYYIESGTITPAGGRPVHLCTGRPPTGVTIPDAV